MNYVAGDTNLVSVLKQGIKYSKIFIIYIKLQISILSHFVFTTNQADSPIVLVLIT